MNSLNKNEHVLSLKGRHEEFHLKVFSTLHCLPGKELPRQDDRQKPDFRYRAGKVLTGIEHTELKRTKSAHGEKSLAELKGIHRKIVERANYLRQNREYPLLR